MKKMIRFVLIPVMLLCLLTGMAANVFAEETVPPQETTAQTTAATEPTDQDTPEATQSTESDATVPPEETIPTEPEKKLIDTVKVSFAEPAAGVVAALPSVPSDANYAVDTGNSWWNRYNVAPPVMGPGETFSAGTSYSLALTLVPTEGYAFHEGTRLYLNGKSVTPAVVSANSLSYYSADWHVGAAIARADVLFDTPEVGKAAKLPTVPDEGYHIDYGNTYWKNETTGKILSQGDVFEAGCSYRLYVSIGNDTGAKFDDKTTLYLTRSTGGSPAYITEQAKITDRTDSVLQGKSAMFSMPGGKEEEDKPVSGDTTASTPNAGTEAPPVQETTQPQPPEETAKSPTQESTEVPTEATASPAGEGPELPAEDISSEAPKENGPGAVPYLVAAGLAVAALLGFGIVKFVKKP